MVTQVREVPRMAQGCAARKGQSSHPNLGFLPQIRCSGSDDFSGATSLGLASRIVPSPVDGEKR